MEVSRRGRGSLGGLRATPRSSPAGPGGWCRLITPTISRPACPVPCLSDQALTASRRSEGGRRRSARAQIPRARASQQPGRGLSGAIRGPTWEEPRRLMLGVIERRVGRADPAAGGISARPRPVRPPWRSPSATCPSAAPVGARRTLRARRTRRSDRRPAPAAPGAHAPATPRPCPPRRARLFRQRRVTFAGPQLPSTSPALTRMATFAVRLRTGRTIPAFGVLAVAIFHGPLFTEYWTR